MEEILIKCHICKGVVEIEEVDAMITDVGIVAVVELDCDCPSTGYKRVAVSELPEWWSKGGKTKVPGSDDAR